MNAPPSSWDCSSSEWSKCNKDGIERVFVALRRECTQLESIDPSFRIRFSTEDVAKFLEEKSVHQFRRGECEDIPVYKKKRTKTHIHTHKQT